MAHAILLILFLIVANFIENIIARGLILLIFALVLTANTILTLKKRKNLMLADKLFYGVLLFLDFSMVIGSVFVIISSIIKTL